MRFQLIDVGASRFNGIVQASTFSTLWNHVRKHTASRGIDIVDGNDKGEYLVFAGLRFAGKIKQLDEGELI